MSKNIVTLMKIVTVNIIIVILLVNTLLYHERPMSIRFLKFKIILFSVMLLL